MASDIHQVLSALPKGPPCLTVDQLADKCGLPCDRTEEAVERLRKLAMVEEYTAACYVATAMKCGSGQDAISLETARSPYGRAWSIIRSDRKVDFGTLLTITGLRLWELAVLRPWLEGLEAAGVLLPLTRAADEEPAWMLARSDMGPRIPVVIHARGGRPLHVYDANTGESLPIARPRNRKTQEKRKGRHG